MFRMCYLYAALFFVRGNWFMPDVFFLYFFRVSLCDTGIHVVWIEICHFFFFLLSFSVRFFLNKFVMCYKSV